MKNQLEYHLLIKKQQEIDQRIAAFKLNIASSQLETSKALNNRPMIIKAPPIPKSTKQYNWLDDDMLNSYTPLARKRNQESRKLRESMQVILKPMQVIPKSAMQVDCRDTEMLTSPKTKEVTENNRIVRKQPMILSCEGTVASPNTLRPVANLFIWMNQVIKKTSDEVESLRRENNHLTTLLAELSTKKRIKEEALKKIKNFDSLMEVDNEIEEGEDFDSLKSSCNAPIPSPHASNTVANTIDEKIKIASYDEARTLYKCARHFKKFDPQSALRYYRLAAKEGYARAQYALGELYRTGTIVQKHGTRAREFFQKAADQGYTKAREKLNLFAKRSRDTTENGASKCNASKRPRR